MIVNWNTGPHKWAFANLVSHLVKAMPYFEHAINKTGDINVFLAPDQLKPSIFDGSPVIFHLDGNRWRD